MDVRLDIFDALLARMPRGRLLDLGCGHGAFSERAAGAGWQVTGVDVRTERWPAVDGVEWVQSDVRTFQIGDDYDCIALLGLLYHLELDDVLDLLGRCAHVPTIIDTHVSVRPTVTVGGYAGHHFGEGDLSAATASWGNPTSFWPTEASLLRMLYAAGYGSVYAHQPWYRPDRTFWLCLPHAALEGWRQESMRALQAADTPPTVLTRLAHSRAAAPLRAMRRRAREGR